MFPHLLDCTLRDSAYITSSMFGASELAVSYLNRKCGGHYDDLDAATDAIDIYMG